MGTTLTRKVEITCPICGKVRSVKLSTWGKDYSHPRCRHCAGKLGSPAKEPSKYFNPKRSYAWRKNAKERNFEWSLTIAQLDEQREKQNGLCALTGLPLTMNSNSLLTVSLDRIDSKAGYCPSNVQYVATVVNRLKQDIPEGQLGWLCGLIAENLNNKGETSVD